MQNENDNCEFSKDEMRRGRKVRENIHQGCVGFCSDVYSCSGHYARDSGIVHQNKIHTQHLLTTGKGGYVTLITSVPLCCWSVIIPKQNTSSRMSHLMFSCLHRNDTSTSTGTTDIESTQKASWTSALWLFPLVIQSMTSVSVQPSSHSNSTSHFAIQSNTWQKRFCV